MESPGYRPLLVAAVLLVTGCGGDDETARPVAIATPPTPTPTAEAAAQVPDGGGFDYCATRGLSVAGPTKVTLPALSGTTRAGLPDLLKAATEGARRAYTSNFDPDSGTVDLYFFKSAEHAAAALPAARKEVASADVVGPGGSFGRAGSVIYLSEAPVVARATRILNRCLVEAGGKRMRLRPLR